MKQSKPVIIDILIYLLFAVAIIICLNGKENFHIDEIFSYGLSNYTHGIYPVFEDGVVYEPASEVLDDYVTVSSDNRFNYPNVFKNQADDVHPPLYYIILHTICSLFPGKFSIWYAGIINIVFSMVMLFFLRRIIETIMPGDMFFGTSMSLGFVLSAGILSANTFLRMYIMAMALCTGFTYLIIRKLKEIDDHYFWVKFSILLIAGALTHYYCVIYDVLLCVAMGIHFIHTGKKNDTRSLVISSAVSGAISLITFPSMINHLFMSSRGRETLKNAVTVNVFEYLQRFLYFFLLTSHELFGSLLLFILVAMIVFFVITTRKKQGKELADFFKTIAVPAISTLAFFVLIVKWAIFIEDRYLYVIYPSLFVLTMSSLFVILRDLIKNQKTVRKIWIAVAAVIVVGSWIFTHWNYTYWYSNQKSIDLMVDNSSDIRAVCIYNESWEIQYLYKDFENIKSVIFIQENDLEKNMNLIDYDSLLYISENLSRLEIRNLIENKFPNIEQYFVSRSERGVVLYISD